MWRYSFILRFVGQVVCAQECSWKCPGAVQDLCMVLTSHSTSYQEVGRFAVTSSQSCSLCCQLRRHSNSAGSAAASASASAARAARRARSAACSSGVRGTKPRGPVRAGRSATTNFWPCTARDGHREPEEAPGLRKLRASVKGPRRVLHARLARSRAHACRACASLGRPANPRAARPGRTARPHLPLPLGVARPQRKVVQHNGGRHRDVERGGARPVLLDVDKGVAQADLLGGQALALWGVCGSVCGWVWVGA